MSNDFSNPKRNCSYLGITPGMIAVDAGAGAGYYTQALAELVGEAGHVYALEIQKELVKRLQSDMQRAGLNNVTTLWSDLDALDGIALNDGIADVVVIANTLFQLEEPHVFFAQAHRLLKKGGKLLVIDWLDSYSAMGPHVDLIVHPDISRNHALTNGFEHRDNPDVGVHHWGQLYVKA